MARGLLRDPRMKRTFALTVIALLLFMSAVAHAGDESRSISRTRRVIRSAAHLLHRETRKVRNQELPALRNAIVRNTAARLALKKEQGKTAMYLTLEARRIARDIMAAHGEANNTGFDADPEESAAAKGGEGKGADGYIAEAEKLVPDVDGIEANDFPYEVDNID